jgi:VCBS repeat-containing protein
VISSAAQSLGRRNVLYAKQQYRPAGIFGDGDDLVHGDPGSDELYGEAGNDILIARGGNNSLDGGEGRDWYVFDTGFDVNRIADSGTGGNGGNGVQFNFAFADRTLSLQEVLDIGMDVVGTPEADTIVGTGMNERINALAGDDIIFAGAGNDTIDAGDGDDSVDAGEGNDLVHGGAGNNTLQGGAGSDSLIGGSGSDWLDGGEGSDFLSGEAGDDIYVVDSAADVIFEAAGIDTVHSSVTLTLAPGLKNLTLTGTASIDATGNDADNTLTGNDGNNQLDGKVGADTTAGGAGDDIYLIDNAGDIVIEALNAGTDTVQSTLATYTLTDNVENLSLNLDTDQDGSGNALDNIITGNAGVNVLAGGEGSDTLFGLGGNDSLDGGSGADVMDGGVGNDTYIVDNAGDQVIESQAGQTTSGMQWVWTGAGTGWQLWPYSYTVIDAADTVNASISYTLGQNLENLTLTGTDNLDGIGNALNNLINGNDGNNTLLGLDGSDSLNGGAGTDVLVGGAGNDVLNGDAGADLMEGGLGHDTYTVDDSGDQVIETALLETWGGQGWDVVNSSVSYTLSDHVEVLMLTGTDNIDGAGSAQDNTLIGNAGINVLAGGQGNDSYIVQTTGDTVVESADEGIDSVESSVDFTLGENVENLSLIDTAVNGTGNALDNAIIGNLVDNTLSGEGGNDYLDGDNGNDYVSGGAGDDEIRGGNDDGNYWYFYSGNQDTLNGGDGNDTIDGQSGNDAIYGGTGNDALFGGDDGGNEESNAVLTNDDMIDGGDGSDSIDGGTGADRLFGGAGDDTIYGGQASQYAGYYDYATDTTTWGVASDNDYLDGGAGLDVLMGEQGDDIYVVDGSYLVVEAAATLNDCGDPVPAQQLAWTTDTVTEYGGEGYDTVLSSASYALTDNVEELRLVFDAGTGATDPQFFADLTTYGQDGTGNDLDNLIVGNELANRLDGGAGADTLEGGAGNDTYVIDSLDTVVENADSGIDTMVTDFDYSLTDANLENLTLLDGALNGQGNAADNVLQGNAAGNFLEGMEGNDKLIGGQGDDDLLGGAGNDRYVFRLGDGADVIDDWQGNDTLFIGNDLTAADIDAERFGDDLLLTIKGTTDSVAVINWFTQAEGVTWLEFCDGSPLDHAEIEALALRAPPLAAPIADQLTEQDAQFSFGVPADAFVDPNAGDTLSYEASLADGSALPAWLAFDAATQTFSGTPSNWDVGSLNLRVTATDNSGLGASSNFVLNVLNVNDAPTVVTALSAQSVTAGQIFEFVLPRGTISASVLDDPTDTGTPDATWTGYDQYFWGSGGNDTYTFTRGDGKVYIGDWDNSPMDTVQLTDVQAADISITQDQWGALTLSVGGTADNLTLGGWLYSDEPRIEQLVFADGSAWGVSEILSMASTQPTIVSDYITGTDGDDAVTALAGDDGVRGWAGNDLLLGGSGNDALEGGGGSDILSGGTGSDDLSGDWNYVDLTNDLLAGGAGNDYLYASISNDLLIGGTGNDEISGNDGNDVLLFNRGDGNDWVYSDESTNDVALEQRTDTVSVGGGIAYVDLSFSRDWDNLILNVGNGESITFSGWFNTSWRDNKAISTLQVIAESMTDYNPDSADPLLNKRVQQFDFVGLANLFEADLAADPTIVEWLLEPHLNEFLLGASDTSAIGGNLAYLYGKSGNLDGLTEAELRAQLGDASFGKANQILTKTTSAAAGGAFGDVDFIHGDSLSYSASLADGSPLPAWLSFDAATGIFSGTPANRDGGVLSVAVTATDTGGLTASSLFSLDVISLNTAPVAVSDTIAIDEDDGLTSVSVAGLLANDIDPDVGDMLSIVGFDGVSAQGNAVTMDAAGDLVFAIGGSYQSLAEGQTATDSFAYTVADLDGEISTAIVDVVITGANDAPVAATPVTDQLTDEDAFFSFAIPTDSFTDIDHGDALTYTATLADGSELPSWLSFDVATQTFSGMPLNTDVGNFGVLVTATDTGGLSATSEFALEVMNVNDVPIAADDAGNAIEDGGAVLLSSETLLANDTDPDSIHGDVLSIVGVSQAVSGAAVSLVNGTVRYDIGTLFQSLGEGQIAADTFSYTAMDTSGATSTANVHMTVTGTNDAPIVETAIANQTTLEDVPFSFTIPTDSFTDIDTGDTLTYSAKLADGSALPSWLSFDVATQTFSGTPLNGDVGNLDVLVTATDTGGLSVTGAFALDVLNVNDVPIAADDVGNAIEDGGAVLMSAASLLTNDSDPDFIHGDVLSIVGVSQADSGAAVALVNGAVEYDIGTLFQSLGEGQTTVDTFSYTVSDVAGATSTATVTMTVAGVNDGPVTAEDAAAVGEDASLVAVGNVLANDSDVDQGTVLSVAGAVSLQGNYGSLVLNADGSYGYALDNVSAAVQGLMAGQAVADVFAYQATDGLAATPGRLTVTITGSNDAPVAQDDGSAIDEDNLLTIQAGALLANDTDADIEDTAMMAGVDGVSILGASVSLVNGAVVYDQGGRFNSLMAGMTVTDSFGYTMTDGVGAVSSATVSITVSGVNDGPTANSDAAATDEDTALTTLMVANLMANDTDVDAGDVLSFAGFDSVSVLGNAVSVNTAGDLVFDIGNRYQYLAQGETLTDTFSYSIADTAGAISSTRVEMTIAGRNDAPVAAADIAWVQEDLVPTATGNVLNNDGDVDQGTVLSVADAGHRTGSYGSLALAVDGTYAYTTDTASSAVQSLGRTARVVEQFAYTATDGMAGAGATLEVTLAGTNDAPIVVKPLTDVDIRRDKDFCLRIPADSFFDIDQGDALDFTATLSDGSALPCWLKFDAVNLTLHGEAPKELGFVDVRIVATDRVAATGSREGSLSTADVMRLNIVKKLSGEDDDCGDDHHGHGNEGVGNGEDPPPPGHDYNHNDGPGTGPGYPGNRHGQGRNDHEDEREGDEHHGKVNDKRGKCLDLRSVADHCERFGDKQAEIKESSRDHGRAFAQWLAVDQAIARQASTANHGLPSLSRDKGADLSGLHSIGKDSAIGKRTGVDPISLLAGGQDRQVFKGLSDGMRRFGG